MAGLNNRPHHSDFWEDRVRVTRSTTELIGHTKFSIDTNMTSRQRGVKKLAIEEVAGRYSIVW